MSIWLQKTFSLKSRSQGCYLITDQLLSEVGAQIKQVQIGLCNVFMPHTSAGIALGENADSTVRSDMQKVFNKLVPQGKGLYEHDYQGPDDMPAHVKSILSGVSINIPISKGRLALGTWQGLWLMQFRTSKHTRYLTVTIQGQKSQE